MSCRPAKQLSLVLSELNRLPQPQPAAQQQPLPDASHHVVSVEAPSLPKRRFGICCFALLACWALSTVGLAVAILAAGRSFWGTESLTASFILRRIKAEGGPCTLRVFAGDCDVTRLQLHVALGLLLEGIVTEDEIEIAGQGGDFEARLSICGPALADALASEAITATLKARLALFKSCSVFVSKDGPRGAFRRGVHSAAEAPERGVPDERATVASKEGARVGKGGGTVEGGRGGARVARGFETSQA